MRYIYIYIYIYVCPVCVCMLCACACVCACVYVSSICYTIDYVYIIAYKSMEYSFFFFYIYIQGFFLGKGEKNYLKTYQNHAFICVYTHVSYLSRKHYAIFRNINIHSLIPCTSGVRDRAKSPSRTDEKNLGRDIFSQSS